MLGLSSPQSLHLEGQHLQSLVTIHQKRGGPPLFKKGGQRHFVGLLSSGRRVVSLGLILNAYVSLKSSNGNDILLFSRLGSEANEDFFKIKNKIYIIISVVVVICNSRNSGPGGSLGFVPVICTPGAL